MKNTKFKLNSLLSLNGSVLIFAIFPMLLCSLGCYGLLITQVENPSFSDHMIMSSIGISPAIVLFFILFRMERSRRLRDEKRFDKKNMLNRYSKETPFNNGNSLLSRFDGDEFLSGLNDEEIVVMKAELKKQMAQKNLNEKQESENSSQLNIKIDDFPTAEGKEYSKGTLAYFNHARKLNASPKPVQEVNAQKQPVQEDRVLSLEEALQKRIDNAKTPQEAAPFRPINDASVQDTLKRLEVAKRLKSQ
jgi:hypothetical protein